MQARPISANIFAILNIGFGAFSWLELFFFQPMADLTKQAPAHSTFHALAGDPSQAHWLWLTALIDSLGALVLIAGGVGLLAGRNWGRIASLAWGAFDVVFCLLRFPLNWSAVHAAVLALSIAAPFVSVLTWSATILGTIAGLVYPALLLYFMTRPKLVAAYKA